MMPAMTKKPKKASSSPGKQDLEFLKTLSNQIHHALSERGYRPLKASELMQKIELLPENEPRFHDLITQLIKDDAIEVRNGRISLRQDENAVATGVLRVHPRGFGFLQPEDRKKYPEDIFIPRHLTLNAVDGDQVEVLVNTTFVSEKGPEGKVVNILSRGRTHIAGTIVKEEGGELFAYVPLLGSNQQVKVISSERELKVGDRVILHVIEWGHEKKSTLGELSHYIGHISDPSCDIKATIEEYELPYEFSNSVKNEVIKFGKIVPKSALIDRLDFREIETFTIDPDTAKDFDDAVSLSLDQKGHYHLSVHIADVSYYVQKDTALDKEARLRCNSTYFPGTVIPMLPHELSSHLCSLKADVNRLTVSVIMEFDQEANLLHYKIARSVIRSHKRFTYKEAKKVLDGVKKSIHAPTLQLMVDLCHRLKRKRYERGSIEFSLPDVAIRVDEKGMPQNIEFIAYDITHQMVEEFMLKANEVVAAHLSKNGKSLAYRVHQEPDEENIKNFSMIAQAFGFTLSDIPTSQELQELFEEAKKTTYGQYLATCFIRSMKLAHYSPENIGHYGLSLDYYCHFTSPIRRYIDLIVHRALFDERGQEEDFDAIALQCSEKERLSARAEGSVVVLKKLRLLKAMQEENSLRQFEAVVTQVKQFGFVFEIMEFLLEGFLHVADLEEDYFIYDESSMRLRGRHKGISYRSGDRITVMLKTANLTTLETRWNIVPEKKTIKSNSNGSKQHKKRNQRKQGSSHRRSRKKRMG